MSAIEKMMQKIKRVENPGSAIGAEDPVSVKLFADDKRKAVHKPREVTGEAHGEPTLAGQDRERIDEELSPGEQNDSANHDAETMANGDDDLEPTLASFLRGYNGQLEEEYQIGSDVVMPEALKTPGLTTLYTKVRFLLAPAQNSVVQFMGPTGGEGVSTIAREFAHMAAIQTGNPVLLVILDANNGEPKLTTISQNDELDVSRNSQPLAHRNETEDSRENTATSKAVTVPIRERMGSYLDVVRQRFSFVIIDSTPATSPGQAMSLCAKVDGVVLVLAANSTHREVTRMVTEKIQSVGGRVLGVVVNRRRSYIPRFLERLLGW
ncbi:MAG: hypothetical protein OET44_03180 [Gammaproteobacteria bacterium]|nr:hypothetical protein [Gammaproteobacteria bacterium]